MDGTMMAPLEPPSLRYGQGVAAGDWEDDPAQRTVLPAFDRLYQQAWQKPASGWAERLRVRLHGPLPVRGLYLWGPVGRGKTLLMDQFVASLPPGVGLRLHFHHFMLDVHTALRTLGEVRDPLPRVAADYAVRVRFLCLDEFMVTDIGDAMILYGLLAALFDHGVALVATSNTAPAELYQGGLQRERFMPAIALLEKRCEVSELASERDWRLRALTRAPVYLAPDNAHAEAALARLFTQLAQGQVRENGSLTVNERALAVRRWCARAAWFDFAALCEGPRGSADYVELARRFPAILVSHVPQFTPFNEDAAQRFVHLVDELYDRRIKFALTAQVPTVELYDGNRLRGEFARTVSRLIEMQSREYLAVAVGHPQAVDAMPW